MRYRQDQPDEEKKKNFCRTQIRKMPHNSKLKLLLYVEIVTRNEHSNHPLQTIQISFDSSKSIENNLTLLKSGQVSRFLPFTYTYFPINTPGKGLLYVDIIFFLMARFNLVRSINVYLSSREPLGSLSHQTIRISYDFHENTRTHTQVSCFPSLHKQAFRFARNLWEVSHFKKIGFPMISK